MRKVLCLLLFWTFTSSAIAQNIPVLPSLDFSVPKILSAKSDLTWQASKIRLCCDIYELRIANMQQLVPDSSLLSDLCNRIVGNLVTGTIHYPLTTSRAFELLFRKPWESEKVFIPKERSFRNNWDY